MKLKFYRGQNPPMELDKVREVQKLNLLPFEERFKSIEENGCNTFQLKNKDVFLDMLSDSGTNAMCDNQIAPMMVADDAYAGSASGYKLGKVIKNFTFFVLMAMLLALSNTAFSQIASWNLTGINTAGGVKTAPVTTKDAGVTVSNLVASNALGAPNDYFKNIIGGGNMANAMTLATAISAGNYVEFTITPAAGKSVSITSIDVSAMTQGGVGTVSLLSSVNGFTAANLISSIPTGLPNEVNIMWQNFPVTGHDNLTTATTFRFYFNSTLNWGFNYKAVGIGNRHAGEHTADLVVNGSVGVGAADAVAPTTPTGLTVGAVGSTTVALSWNASINVVGITTYDVYLGAILAGTATGTTYTVTGLTASTAYSFTVIAKDGFGSAPATAAVNATTTAPSSDVTAPTVPTSLAATNLTTTSLTLNWTASTDAVGVIAYDVYQGASLIGSPTTNTYAVSGLNPGTAYSFTVKAKDANNNISDASSPLTVTTVADVPSGAGIASWNLTGINTAGGVKTAPVTTKDAGITVSNLVASNALGAPNDYFKNYIGGGNMANAMTLATAISAGNYVEFTITPAAGKSVSITSIDLCALTGGGVGTVSLLSSVNGFTATNLISSIPTGLPNEVNILWQNLPVTGHNKLTTATTFRFYFNSTLNWGFNYKAVGIGNRHAGEHTADLVVNGIVEVIAADAAAPTTPTGLTVGAVGSTTVALSWNASINAVGTTTYDVYRGATLAGTATGTTYTVTGLTASTAYSFTVIAKDGFGSAAATAAVNATTTAPSSDVTAPTVPTALAAANVTTTSLTLNWTASTDAVGVIAYDVYQGAGLIGSPTTNTFAVTGLTPGTDYSFTVKAKDANNNISDASIALPVTTADVSSGQTKRVYMIGNSVTDGVNYNGFSTLAQDPSGPGNTLIWARHMIPGSPLFLLWNASVARSSGFVETPYGFPSDAFVNYEWDAITLQPFDRHLVNGDPVTGDGDVAQTVRYANLAKTKSPNVQFYILGRYPRAANDNNDPANDPASTGASWNALHTNAYTGGWDNTNETRDYYEKLTAAATAANPTLNKPFLMIPLGEVMYSLNNKMIAGQVPGYTKIWQFYADGIHLNSIGSYVNACTFYATIYKESPVGRIVPSEYGDISPALALIIQQTTWEVVSTYAPAGILGTAVVPVSSLAVSPTTLSVAIDQTYQLIPSVSPSNASNQNVTWTSSNNAIATVNSSGLITGKAVGNATITVTSAADPTKNSSCAVTVSSGSIAVTGLSISPATASIKVGKSSSLALTVSPLNATNTSVNWTSSNPVKASVDANGVVTALEAGATTITATSVSDGTKTATCVVTVLANTAPVAVIDASVLSGAAPLVVDFNSSGSTDADAGDYVLGFEWDFDDATAIERSSSPSHTFTSAGTYVVKLRVMDNNNLYGSIVTTTITVTPEVINDITKLTASNFELYPNPVVDQLTLNFGTDINNATVSILDLHGRSIMTKSAIRNGAQSIDVSNLKSGIYFVKVMVDGKVMNSKFVKK